MKTHPLVSIGMPVYNGENFVKSALDSILAQTYETFEVIICDNASTDRTKEICESYCTKDDRIKYFRNRKNYGASKNYNLTFEKSSGKYFKWATHDDAFSEDFLSKCVEQLEKDHSVVLCYSKTKCIDENGRFLRVGDFKLDTGSSKPQDRFRDLILVSHWCTQVFGLYRKNILQKTSLIGSYPGSDRVLLAQLSLYGKFFEIPEYLFYWRKHSKQSVKAFPNRRSRLAWFDTSNRGFQKFPEWKILFEYFTSVMHSPLNIAEKISCNLYLIKWLIRNRGRLVDDVRETLKYLLTSPWRTNRSVPLL